MYKMLIDWSDDATVVVRDDDGNELGRAKVQTTVNNALLEIGFKPLEGTPYIVPIERTIFDDQRFSVRISNAPEPKLWLFDDGDFEISPAEARSLAAGLMRAADIFEQETSAAPSSADVDRLPDR